MNKIAVVYFSGTGNTEMMANAIADGDECARAVACAVEGSVEDLWVRTLRAQTKGTTVTCGSGADVR